MSAAKPRVGPGHSYEWEALITWRHGPCKIKTRHRSHSCGDSGIFNETDYVWGPTRYALTLRRALRKAERMVEQLNRRPAA